MAGVYQLMINLREKGRRNQTDMETLVIQVSAGISALVVVLAAYFAMRNRNEFFVTADQQGQQLLNSGNADSAAGMFDDPSWRGVAKYRAGQFEDAGAVFAAIPGAEAAFNHGNCLVMQGKYEEAVKRYDRALQLFPEWEAAETNRAIALGRAQRMNLKGGEMTGGKLGADDIVFSNNKSNQGSTETVEAEPISDEELRGIWLRQVQTTPSQFLRAKFAYQNANRQQQKETDE